MTQKRKIKKTTARATDMFLFGKCALKKQNGGLLGVLSLKPKRPKFNKEMTFTIKSLIKFALCTLWIKYIKTANPF